MAEKEYIEREAALKANCYFCSAHLEDDSPCVEKCADYMKFIEIPVAPVAPVVKGKWIKDCDYHFRCSVCGDRWTVSNGNPVDAANGWNYCPNCGAKMEGI